MATLEGNEELPRDPLPEEREIRGATAGAEQDRDLGFGSVVAEEARQRLLNRDGSFNVARRGLGLLSELSLYHSLLTMSWARFVGLFALVFLALNVVFATAYATAGPDAIAGEITDTFEDRAWLAFFFSVQTFSTVGYGHLYPATFAARWIMTAQALVGILTVALITGLVFARFSRPMADVIFSRRAIISPYRDITAFMFRIANRRRNQIVHLDARVIVALRDRTKRGRREFHELLLERRQVYFFPLHWTIVHPIDDESPLAGLTLEELVELDAEFLVLLRGFDETFSQEVHTRSSYGASEVVWNAKFVSLFETHRDGAPITIDLGRLHDYETVEGRV